MTTFSSALASLGRRKIDGEHGSDETATFILCEKILNYDVLELHSTDVLVVKDFFSTTKLLKWEYLCLELMFYTELMLDYRKCTVDNQLFLYTSSTVAVMNYLDVEEPRVRSLCAELVRVLSAKDWQVVTERMLADFGLFIFDKIKATMHRDCKFRETNLGNISSIPLDDTTGWKNLESSLKTYQNILVGLGIRLFDDLHGVDWDILITKASSHTNRHIRQCTHEFTHKLVDSWRMNSSNLIPVETCSKLRDIMALIVKSIGDGLQVSLQCELRLSL